MRLITRRDLLGLALAAALAPDAQAASAASALKAIHKRIGGRLGVHILDSQSGKRFALDDDSRYAMASTFKLPLAPRCCGRWITAPSRSTQILPFRQDRPAGEFTRRSRRPSTQGVADA